MKYIKPNQNKMTKIKKYDIICDRGEIMNKKYAYLKAVLEYGCKIKKGETLLVIIPEEAQEEKNIIKSLKEE